jgi:hypothetical protein
MREILKHVQDDTYRTLKWPESYLILQTFFISSRDYLVHLQMENVKTKKICLFTIERGLRSDLFF